MTKKFGHIYHLLKKSLMENFIFFVQWISKERFNKASKLCKSSKCFDSEAMLSWSAAKVNFFIVNFLKSLI